MSVIAARPSPLHDFNSDLPRVQDATSTPSGFGASLHTHDRFASHESQPDHPVPKRQHLRGAMQPSTPVRSTKSDIVAGLLRDMRSMRAAIQRLETRLKAAEKKQLPPSQDLDELLTYMSRQSDRFYNALFYGYPAAPTVVVN